MPGHTTAWFVGYPELASAPGPYGIERNWGILNACMNPANEKVYEFLDPFIGEMAGLFPDEFFHVGGDEVNGVQWKSNTEIQAFMKQHDLKSTQELQAYFSGRVLSLVEKHGKRTLGWDEVLQPGVPKSLVIQSWRGQKSLAEASRRGYMGILSAGYYLDLMQPASQHYGVDPLEGATAGLAAEEKSRILGGEACMWDEYATPQIIDAKIWPRMAAIAERLWSPQRVKNVDSMYARLALVSRWLDFAGLQHRSSYPLMFERLTDHKPFENLWALDDILEPVKGYSREEMRKYDSFSPLNRLVDTARPESERIWELEQLARTQPESAELRLAFTEWSRSSELLQRLPQNFYVAEIATVAEDLSAVGLMGLDALSYLESSKAIPENWISTQRKRLDQMEKPKSEVRLAAVRPVRVLLDALSRRGVVTGNTSNAPIKH